MSSALPTALRQFGTSAPTVVVVMGAASVGLLACLSLLFVYWVYLDAGDRGSDRPRLWALCTLVVLPASGLYFVLAGRIGERQEPVTARKRLVETALIAGCAGVFLTFLFAPPDPFVQLTSIPASLVLTFPAAYLLWYRRGLGRLRSVG
ncbi:hypothetical protein SAMN05216559_0506 [Halomicrobium zhouii]|uniref:Uncharacterized protein n=1 Tax=Halomicrobium zhouii TaxID=767519 RepID=A0A1I6KBK7_9EURY|nr:hypothetical protein [Halomicrobium zhouii]SFR88576.1 hypothetical protein SAMN05216559_0506 [Halomicrobium zhouii]